MVIDIAWSVFDVDCVTRLLYIGWPGLQRLRQLVNAVSVCACEGVSRRMVIGVIKLRNDHHYQCGWTSHNPPRVSELQVW